MKKVLKTINEKTEDKKMMAIIKMLPAWRAIDQNVEKTLLRSMFFEG
jgi:hypothetical protein